MASRCVDFDRARAERQREPIVLLAYGRTFELPASIPAAFVLDVIRLQQEAQSDADDVTEAQAIGIMQHILPRAVLDELLQEPEFSAEDMLDLVRLVMDAYQDSPGEASSPTTLTEPKRSSSSGA